MISFPGITLALHFETPLGQNYREIPHTGWLELRGTVKDACIKLSVFIPNLLILIKYGVDQSTETEDGALGIGSLALGFSVPTVSSSIHIVCVMGDPSPM